MLGLDSLAPRFLVSSRRIRVLYEPNEFYSHLCQKIRSAKSRVFLASLYLGKSETDLINVLSESLQKNEKLRVYVLVDALRGTREAPEQCSASLLAPLAKHFPGRVHLSMYKTPKLGSIAGAILPKRIIEGAGLQHMKMYGWDDEIMLSGANLSQDYFTNRQDRYVLIADGKVTNYFFDVYSAVADLSYKLVPADNAQQFDLIKPVHVKAAKRKLAALLRPQDYGNGRASENATEVYPVCQFTPLRLGNEHEVMRKLTEAAATIRGISWTLTAGYFNVEPQLASNLARSTNPGTVIVASPEANGFFESKGVSGHIPRFYSFFARNFSALLPPKSPVSMLAWQKGVVNQPEGWSYHAKGMWMNMHDKTVTYIGSSNFTRRSYRHDIECGAVLVTDDVAPYKREQEHLLENCVPFNDKTKLTPSEQWFLRVFGDRL